MVMNMIYNMKNGAKCREGDGEGNAGHKKRW